MNTKPILIDALHINMGGALMIMNHLLDQMVQSDIPFWLLKDNRCPSLRSETLIPHIVTMSSSEKHRLRFYKNHKYDFSSVLCMGNVPPPIRMDANVMTYVHNVSLLQIPASYSQKSKVLAYIKRAYINHRAKNTDSWVVQTENTKNIVQKHLDCRNKEVLIYPFYRARHFEYHKADKKRDDYVFIGEWTGAKGHEYLIEAWRILSKTGFSNTLHLTVSAPHIARQIEDAVKDGAHINNHGFVSSDQVFELYKISKAIIYPSLNESLGLGLIEAIEAGCDVIGCDLPYLHSVCEPSELFEPCNANSIVEAVLKYENSDSAKSALKIKDEVKYFVKYLSETRHNH